MSVSQVKRQFEEMSAYLGRDVAGQAKLKTLKDAVNTIRTSLAAAEQRAEHAIALQAATAEREVDIKQQLAETTLENHRLNQQIANLQRELAGARAAVVSVDDEPDDDAAEQPTDGKSPLGKAGTEHELKPVIKELRRRLKYCPRMVKRVCVKGARIDPVENHQIRDLTYDRNSLARGWSHSAMWTLGAAVAVLAAYNGNVTIQTQDLFALVDTDTDSDASVYRPIIQWLARHNINFGTTRKAGYVKLTNVDPTK